MLKHFKRLFRTPTAGELARKQLEEYQIKQIEQAEAAAYHAKMAEYYSEGVKRMNKLAAV